MHTDLMLAQLRWTEHITRIPESDFQRKFYSDNYKRKSALKVARRNATKTPSKPELILCRLTEGTGYAGLIKTTIKLIMKKRESIKLKESTESTMSESMGHPQFLQH